MEKRLEKYKETGNTEFLADIANFAMIEFMYPQHLDADYIATDGGACEIEGFGINEINVMARKIRTFWGRIFHYCSG